MRRVMDTYRLLSLSVGRSSGPSHGEKTCLNTCGVHRLHQSSPYGIVDTYLERHFQHRFDATTILVEEPERNHLVLKQRRHLFDNGEHSVRLST